MTAAVPSRVRTKARNILIVEDEALIALDLERRLAQQGYHVCGVASSAAEALGMIDLRPDLILMDIRIEGGRDGIEIAEEIRRKFDIPLLFLTAHADSDTIHRAACSGPQGYIVKPFRTADFQSRIEVACQTWELERKLRRSEGLLAATLDNVADGVIATDPGNRVEFLNRAAEHLTGWSAAEAKGRPLDEVFRTVDPVTLLPVDHGAPADGIRAEFHLIPRGRAGKIAVESVRSSNAGEPASLGAVIAFRDVTSLRELERRDRQNQRMETVATMAGSLAHDFNNLLTIMLGYADVLQSDPLRRCEELEQIRQAGWIAARLSRDLLTVSKVRMGEPAVLDLNGSLRDLEGILDRIVRPGARLQIVSSPQSLRVSADPTEIQQILINLTTNARDAMPNGGTLTFDTTGSDESWAVLTVTDTGTGMSPEALDRIFEPYFTCKGEKGSGLGLTIVHSIVRRWGGSISVESEPGKGTVFRIRLPRVHAPDRRAAPGTPAAAFPKAACTVLLVEDNDAIRNLIDAQLRREGFTVLGADSGDRALQLLDTHRGDLDVVVTDILMPRMTGAQLASQCLARFPRAFVLFVSGYSGEILAENELIRSGRAEFIPKPVKPRDLLSRIYAGIGRH